MGSHRSVHKAVAIFDLDGCLFDDSWRLKLIKDEGDDRYDEYHEQLHLDKPLSYGMFELGRALAAGAFIFIATARPVSVQGITVEHFKKVTGLQDGDFSIMMRKYHDKRPAPEVKAEMANAIAGWAHKECVPVVMAVDDRVDVLEAYARMGIDAFLLNAEVNNVPQELWKELEDFDVDEQPVDEAFPNIPRTASLESVANLMDLHASTFRDRYQTYGNNAEVVGRLQQAMFPNGVVLATAKDHEMWHLFELMLVKLTRFASSGLKHVDSINDLPAYCGMVHNLVDQHDIKFK